MAVNANSRQARKMKLFIAMPVKKQDRESDEAGMESKSFVEGEG